MRDIHYRRDAQLEQLVEDQYKFESELLEIMRLVIAEWKSDPMSVQCFDLRIVERAKYLEALLVDNAQKQKAIGFL
jgi:hypothetical protein